MTSTHLQKIKNFIAILLLCFTCNTFAQVKIGNDINAIDANSILELDSNSKALVITRLTDAEMNALVPLQGGMVYNTDVKCIFVFEGTLWKSLCNSEIMVITATTPPSNVGEGDIWINENDNKVYLWDGTSWVPVTNNPSSGIGPPNASIPSNMVAGDIYVDSTTGAIYTYTGTAWIDQSVQASNALSKTNNTVELGGSLTKATAIGTNTSNTLAITGLEEITDNENALISIEPTTGILKKTPVSALVQQEEIIIIASNAQTQFTPPLAISNSNKLNVYRNGVKLGFTVINDTTIALEAPVFCYQNDEIRIVQFY